MVIYVHKSYKRIDLARFFIYSGSETNSKLPDGSDGVGELAHIEANDEDRYHSIGKARSLGRRRNDRMSSLASIISVEEQCWGSPTGAPWHPGPL